MLEKAFYYVKIKKMKSESGLSLAIASQPYKGLKFLDFWLDSWLWVGAICQYCFKQDQCQNDDRISFCLKGVTPYENLCY